MSDMNADTLREFTRAMAEGDLSVSVNETPWGDTTVSISDNTGDKFDISREQMDQFTSFIEQYESVIVDAQNIDDTYDGVDRMWHMGKLAEETIDEALTNGSFAMITGAGYSREGTFIGQMRNLYRIFPNQGYNADYYSPSALSELTHTVDDETVRQINKNVVEHDVKVDKGVGRVIRDLNQHDTTKAAAQNASTRSEFDNTPTGDTAQKIADSAKLVGRDVSKNDVLNWIK